MKKNKQDKFKEAWGLSTDGAKFRFYNTFGYNRQQVHDVIKNGRKDEAIIDSMILALKQASKDALKDAQEKNKKIQKV